MQTRLRCVLWVFGALVLCHAHAAPPALPAPARLTSATLEVTLQGGVPITLRNLLTGQSLISAGTDTGAAEIGLFGPGTLRLAEATLRWKASAGKVSARYEFPDGSAWSVRWSVDPTGDLVVRSSGHRKEPVGQFRFPLQGCNIRDFQLVTVTNFGVGETHRAPWVEPPAAAAHEDYFPPYVQPLVALFEGPEGGFVVEGRCLEVGPANLIAHGQGDTADLTFIRGLPRPSAKPEMYEIRLRAYKGRWTAAVDPYVAWLERDVGLVPLTRQRHAWVNDIRAQTYVDPREWVTGEGLAKLERLATELVPAETLLGKISEYRPIPEFGFDLGYPDYTPTEESRRFIRRARELGFHVSVHVNTTGIDMRFKDLIERFRPGLQQTGTDDTGAPVYWGPRFTNAYGQVNFAYCSTAYKPWRKHLIARLRDVIEAGADVIYLDESHTPAGAFSVEGATAIQGVMALQREILKAYPHVAIQTEQFNPMNARHASFALTSMPLGHPLSGYLFQRFVKVCCWYGMYQLSEDAALDRWESWGFLVPGADSDPTWLDLAKAFQRFDLEPDPYRDLGAGQRSAFRGTAGAEAFFATRDRKRGLLVRDAAGAEQWFGQRETTTP